MARFGPVKPNLIETWPEIMLMIEAGTKNGEMRRGPRSLYSLCVCLDHRQAADARADHAADALGALLVEGVAVRQAGVLHRLDRRGHAVVDEGVHVAGFLAGHVLLDIEALDLAGEAAGKAPRHRTW